MPTLRLLHPGPRTLQRFADGELSRRARARASGHLAACAECRAVVAFARDVRSALAAPRLAPASPTLIERVIAERARGSRTILPVEHPAPSRRRRAGVWAAFAGAAVAAAIVALATHAARAPHPAASTGRAARSSAGDAPAGDTNRDAVDQRYSVAALFLPEAAFAARPAPSARRAPPAALSGARLRPGRVEFAQLRAGPAGRLEEVGRGTAELLAVSVDGRSAWRLAQVWRVGTTVEAETLFVDRASLGLLGRAVHVTPYRSYREITVRQRVLGDSVVGWMHTDRGLGRPIARRLAAEGGPYVTDAFAPYALSGTELAPGWRGSLSLLGWAVRVDDVAVPVDLEVVGAERVTTPAGTFDCWRLALRANGRTLSYWVRRTDGLGVRTRDDAPRDGGGAREIVLVRG
jgi:hypothetical protein